MEIVERPPVDPELDLLTHWGDPVERGRTRTAAVLSVLAHAAAILVLLVIPTNVVQPPRQEVHHIVTPLIEPLTELTQKAPTEGKIQKEFSARAEQPRPRIQVPASPPALPKAAPPRPAVIPPAPAQKAAAPVPLPEPPKLEAVVKEPPKVDLPAIAAPPPPQIQAQEKPKITFESPSAPQQVAPGRGVVPIPGSPVSDAIRQAARGNTPGGLTVGDGGGVGVGTPGFSQPPLPGSQGSTLQLLSDPMGVDFRPYLMQILATVKRNWMSVIPESVKYAGRRGKTAIQFSLARDGKVIKLVIAVPSGADALDRAAVAGISASNPFPPLPGEFKGDRIVLQFNFAYNMPRQ